MKKILNIKCCHISDMIYKNVLRETYGIGDVKIDYKMLTLSKLFTNSCFSEQIISGGGIGSSQQSYNYVGIVNSDFNLDQFIGYFDNDDHAGANGVPVEGIYYLSQTNTYGLPFGMSKRRAEPLLS